MTRKLDEASMMGRLARQDVIAFTTLIANSDVELRIACFHGQQAVEKFIKAVLVKHGSTFIPTHDLIKLADLLLSANIPLPLSLDELKRLNPYAVVFRYDDRDIDLLTRENAVSIVNTVASWAAGYLESDLT
jgi:HEPN domain-containing protein